MEESLQIGKVADKFNIHVAKLRDWCNKGLIESYRGPRNARFIPETEFDKIEKIEEMMLRDPKPTFEKVKDELFKSDLVVRHEKNELQEQMNNALQEVFKREGIFETFEMMAYEFQDMKKEMEQLKESKQQFLELNADIEKIKMDLEKERELKVNAEIELVEVQSELRRKEDKKKSFFEKMFG